MRGFPFVPRKLNEALGKLRKTDEDVKAYQESIELEKGDTLAMIIAALITFLPVAIIAMAVIYGLVWLLLVR